MYRKYRLKFVKFWVIKGYHNKKICNNPNFDRLSSFLELDFSIFNATSVPVKSLRFSFTVRPVQTGFKSELTGLDGSSYCGQ